ncbi:multiprotein-bridging factor 1 family protein [Streptomyces bacillaris]|uniref:helix-turn-helix domain-containing protein n=1 Tax=Streptomyces bacillaris TaxID=68179 RepID=UPI0035D9CDCB
MADHHPIRPARPGPSAPSSPSSPSSPDALSPQGRGRPPSAFGQALREARERKGLTLARLRDHLARRGVRVSTVTLSHWQRGRSQPERPESLRAVSAIESILGCPAGGLLALLGPRRPRGRPLPTPPERLENARPVYGPEPLLARALGEEEFSRLNEGTVPVSVQETVHLDRTGRTARHTVTQVVRATHDGADHVTAHLNVDEPPGPPMTASAQCGVLLDQRCVPALGLTTLRIGFGRPLARGESTVVAYTVDLGPHGHRTTHHERALPLHVRHYFLHVVFHPEALPASVYGYYRAHDGAPRADIRTLPLSGSGTAHILPADAAAGVHGIFWKWPGTTT